MNTVYGLKTLIVCIWITGLRRVYVCGARASLATLGLCAVNPVVPTRVNPVVPTRAKHAERNTNTSKPQSRARAP